MTEPPLAPTLSICIPTYNRAALLATALESVLSQAQADVEVVVCDNASRDDTALVVETFSRRGLNVRYFKWRENVGFDRNLLQCVSMAAGQYCWLLGDDDALEEGAVEKLRHLLTSEPTGVCTGVQYYESDLKTKRSRNSIVYCAGTTHFVDPVACFSTLGNAFGFMSSQIVNRSIWNMVLASFDAESHLNGYIHLHVIARMVFLRPDWYYFDDKLISCRTGNDSAATEGMLKRMDLDLKNYSDVVGEVYGNNPVVKDKVMKMLLKEYSNSQIIIVKLQKGANLKYITDTFMLMKKYYSSYSSFWLTSVPILLTPNAVLIAARDLKKRMAR
ncbi:abequosyltransferase [Deinococcus metalli]|uniref:Abequosyltransferase n=1 Tax=Deinococcus metalli TaxID=1141878 RepID=A0A7W8KCR4_9DEIO|nr:glycosyltransferase family 2 protein [Deinococcus metalli]MBB5375774.1 abequosyltransferase [Deinococcus metalli]GHF37155.1 glycosyl transferase [Deinococcus metalli]